MAARAEGLVAIDGVFNDIADTAGFEAECRQALEFGYDGKTLIHPSQIDGAIRGVRSDRRRSRSRPRHHRRFRAAGKRGEGRDQG